MAEENIYQIFIRHGKAGFFVRRNSWTHPRTVAQIVSVGGRESGPLEGAPPYYKSPEVIADISYQGRLSREKLTSPGTYAYIEIQRPDWWPK